MLAVQVWEQNGAHISEVAPTFGPLRKERSYQGGY